MLAKVHPSLSRAGRSQIFTFAMQRSGQHLVIDWICRGLESVVHVNHCRIKMGIPLKLEPLTGRLSVYRSGTIWDSGKAGRVAARTIAQPDGLTHELFSMEDVLPSALGYQGIRKSCDAVTVVIVREPANWLASSLKHPKATERRLRRKVSLYVGMLRWLCSAQRSNSDVLVRFDEFVASRAYRESLARTLQLQNVPYAETALGEVPSFGGGSSFEGTELKPASGAVLQRWTEYESNPLFRELLHTPQLRELSTQVFGHDCLSFLD